MTTEKPTHDVAEALSTIHEAGTAVRERELQKAVRKLDGLDAADREVIETLAERLADGVLAAPTQSLLRAAAEADPERADTALVLFGEASTDADPTDDRPAESTRPGVARVQE